MAAPFLLVGTRRYQKISVKRKSIEMITSGYLLGEMGEIAGGTMYKAR